jgi:hypothetical protein
MEVSGRLHAVAVLPSEHEDSRLDGPQSGYRSGGEEYTSCFYRKSIPGHLARSQKVPELSWLITAEVIPNYMVQSYWEANSRSAGQEITFLLGTRRFIVNFRYHVYKSPQQQQNKYDNDYDYDDDNSIQFFILTCWLNSYKSQLQSQHKKINSIQFIYLSAWQQPDKSNYSQALKQQYRIKYNILKNTSALQMK